MSDIREILSKDNFTHSEIVKLLSTEKDDRSLLFEAAAATKTKYIGNIVFFRGLIEFSNICSKNCYYCGIRKDNRKASRYNLSDEEIFEAARFAFESNYGSVVLQGGEVEGEAFTLRMEGLLRGIKQLSDGRLGVTLSLGEQKPDVYKRWFDAGAHRYLLRIESSDRDLYYKIHPQNNTHRFERRLQALSDLRTAGYQVGTGVMIGLPFQTLDHLASDLLFMKEMDIDMCGMGPYIEHADTPLWNFHDGLLPIEERFNLSLKMIAILRLMMKNINIASATALQAIDPIGREKALKIGANIIMPNITPGKYRDDYKLYENKPCTDEEASDCKNCLEARIHLSGNKIGYDEWGDSLHFKSRKEEA
ncbi:MAG: [FeFe] hydrogenase H-cluster radical SAM maturase HydE [Lentimicrobium sp.]|nr:[FeFe] hydrogenase H-cluster radical SAM maturase HydE [Lentimicrobium sp.]